MNPPLPPSGYADALSTTTAPIVSSQTARLLSRIIFGSLLCLLVVVAVPYGTVEPWWEAFFECTIFGLTALWIAEGWLCGQWQITERALLLPMMALLIFSVVQAIPFGNANANGEWVALSADPFNTLRFALKMLALTLAGLLFFSHINSRKRLRVLILTILCVALISALFGLLRQTAQRDAAGFFLPYLPLKAGYGQFINSNHFAYLMELALGFPLSFVLSRSLGRERWLLFAGAAMPLLLAFVFANSRGGFLGLAGAFIFILVFANPARRNKQDDESPSVFSRVTQAIWFRVLMGLVLTGVVLVGISWVGGDPLINKIEAVSGEVSAEADATREGTRRVEIWGATRQMIVANPVTGVGFNGYAVAVPLYHKASGNLIPQQAHNEYLEILASGGAIGGAIWLWFFIAFIFRASQSLQAATHGKQRAVCVGALAGIVAVALHSLVDFGLHMTINALICVALIAIALLTPKLERRDKNTLFRVGQEV